MKKIIVGTLLTLCSLFLLVSLALLSIFGWQAFVEKGVRDFQIGKKDVIPLPNEYVLIPKNFPFIMDPQEELVASDLLAIGWTDDTILFQKVSDTSEEIELGILDTISGNLQFVEDTSAAYDIIGETIPLQSIEELTETE